MKMFKSIISLMLALIRIFSCCSVALGAEEVTQQLGGEEGALSAHADDHNILRNGIHISYLP